MSGPLRKTLQFSEDIWSTLDLLLSARSSRAPVSKAHSAPHPQTAHPYDHRNSSRHATPIRVLDRSLRIIRTPAFESFAVVKRPGSSGIIPLPSILFTVVTLFLRESILPRDA